MSTADNIIQKIIQEAKANASVNIDKAKTQADDIIAQAEKEAEKIKKEILDKAEKDSILAVERNKGIAMLEARKTGLSVKQDIIASVLEGVKEKIGKLESDKLEDLYSKMIFGLNIKGDEEIAFTAEDSSKLGTGFCDRLNRELEKKGLEGSLKLSTETIENGPGFVLRSGKIEINNTFDSIIKMKYSEIEELIIKELF